MAIVFADGFDHYGTDENRMTFYSRSLSFSNYLSSSVSRTGTHSIVKDGGASDKLFLNLQTTYSSLGVGFALYYPNSHPKTAVLILVGFNNSSNSRLINLRLTSTGNLRVYRGSTLIGSTTSQPLQPRTWHYVEFYSALDSSTGSYEVRVDGVSVLSDSGIDTTATTPETVQYLELLSVVSISSSFAPNVNTYMDDLVVWDTSGTVNNTFLGDVRVETFYPNGNGAVQEWTAVGASDAFACVDETTEDGDSTYIEAVVDSSTPLPINSTFDFENVATSVTSINAAVVFSHSKKTDSGTCSVQISMQNGTDESNGADNALPESYAFTYDIFETDPATGSLWTASGLNGSVIDIERTA